LLLEGPNVQITFVLLIFAPVNCVSCETTVHQNGYFVDANKRGTSPIDRQHTGVSWFFG
jgi:hypothetical protein